LSDEAVAEMLDARLSLPPSLMPVKGKRKVMKRPWRLSAEDRLLWDLFVVSLVVRKFTRASWS
jgi:hypothetical protein